MKNTQHYSLADAARLAGVSYGKVWYYLVTGRLSQPERVGRTRVLTLEDVEAVRRFFDDRKAEQDEAIHTLKEEPTGI